MVFSDIVNLLPPQTPPPHQKRSFYVANIIFYGALVWVCNVIQLEFVTQQNDLYYIIATFKIVDSSPDLY